MLLKISLIIIMLGAILTEIYYGCWTRVISGSISNQMNTFYWLGIALWFIAFITLIFGLFLKK